MSQQLEKLNATQQSNVADAITVMSSSTTTKVQPRSIQNEVNTLTQQLREKRVELHQSQVEVERLSKLVDELEKEKVDLSNELNETRVRLNQVMATNEESEQERAHLLNIQFEREQRVQQLETILAELSVAKSSSDVAIRSSPVEMEMIQQRCEMAEAELAHIKVVLDQRETELRKAREMYVEICEEKNNLQETIKAELDAEYECRLKQQVQRVLEEHRLAAEVEFKVQIEEKLCKI